MYDDLPEVSHQGIRALEPSLEAAVTGVGRAPEHTVPGQLREAGGWTPKEAPVEPGQTPEELGVVPKWFCT